MVKASPKSSRTTRDAGIAQYVDGEIALHSLYTMYHPLYEVCEHANRYGTGGI